jgi:hypothetical protein
LTLILTFLSKGFTLWKNYKNVLILFWQFPFFWQPTVLLRPKGAGHKQTPIVRIGERDGRVRLKSAGTKQHLFVLVQGGLPDFGTSQGAVHECVSWALARLACLQGVKS